MYTWEEIEEHVNSCAACPLCRTRKHPVMGRGDHKGKLMLVAEAPGGQEDLAGLPFVGPAGKVLDELLASVEIRREDIPQMARFADKESNPLYPVPKLMDAGELEAVYLRLCKTNQEELAHAN